MNITKENKKYYQHQFVLWLEKFKPNRTRPKIMGSNVMYTINQGCELTIDDLVHNKISIDQYEQFLVNRFTKKGRKDPIGHAKVQRGEAIYFLEFWKYFQQDSK